VYYQNKYRVRAFQAFRFSYSQIVSSYYVATYIGILNVDDVKDELNERRTAVTDR